MCWLEWTWRARDWFVHWFVQKKKWIHLDQIPINNMNSVQYFVHLSDTHGTMYAIYTLSLCIYSLSHCILFSFSLTLVEFRNFFFCSFIYSVYSYQFSFNSLEFDDILQNQIDQRNERLNRSSKSVEFKMLQTEPDRIRVKCSRTLSTLGWIVELLFIARLQFEMNI